MPNFLEYLRQQNIFGAPPLPYPANPMPRDISMGMGMGGMSVPTGDTNAIPPPQFNVPGIEAPAVGQQQDPLQNVQFGMGPLDINQFDIQQGRMPVSGQDMPEEDAGARLRELYNPTNDATQRFEQLVSQYPQEQKPSILRRIGAMLVDYTKGHQAGQQFYEEPRTHAIEDWKNKITPAQQAANLERYENVNQRTLAYNQIAMELREKAQLAREKNDTRNAEIRQQRADIYAFKATHPDWKLILTKGGNIQAFNPQTQETHDTGIPTGSMTELDKMNLQGEQRLEQIGATGAEQKKTEGVRQAGREALAGMRGEQARQTKSVPTGGVGGKAMLPTQIKVDQYNKARELANTRPELAKFIKPGSGANEFDIVKPNPSAWTESGRGPTAQQYSDIINAIYGPATGGRGAGAGPGPASTPPTTGTIRVRTKDGKTGTFKGTAAEAQAAGFIVIGQ